VKKKDKIRSFVTEVTYGVEVQWSQMVLRRNGKVLLG